MATFRDVEAAWFRDNVVVVMIASTRPWLAIDLEVPAEERLEPIRDCAEVFGSSGRVGINEGWRLRVCVSERSRADRRCQIDVQ